MEYLELPEISSLNAFLAELRVAILFVILSRGISISSVTIRGNGAQAVVRGLHLFQECINHVERPLYCEWRGVEVCHGKCVNNCFDFFFPVGGIPADFRGRLCEGRFDSHVTDSVRYSGLRHNPADDLVAGPGRSDSAPPGPALLLHDHTLCPLPDSVLRGQLLPGGQSGPAAGSGGQGMDLWPAGHEETGAGYVQVLRIQLDQGLGHSV